MPRTRSTAQQPAVSMPEPGQRSTSRSMIPGADDRTAERNGVVSGPRKTGNAVRSTRRHSSHFSRTAERKKCVDRTSGISHSHCRPDDQRTKTPVRRPAVFTAETTVPTSNSFRSVFHDRRRRRPRTWHRCRFRRRVPYVEFDDPEQLNAEQLGPATRGRSRLTNDDSRHAAVISHRYSLQQSSSTTRPGSCRNSRTATIGCAVTSNAATRNTGENPCMRPDIKNPQVRNVELVRSRTSLELSST